MPIALGLGVGINARRGGGGSAPPPGPVLDSDAAAYIAAVEAPGADNQELEAGVRTAINDFVVGCKADDIWDAIKASCIMAGARTLSGALVPLKGTAPTSFNFVSGDYDRKTGLVGNGSTKYLDSNRNNNADPQDNNHNAVFVSALGQNNNAYTGVSAGQAASGTNAIIQGVAGNLFTRNRSSQGTDSGAAFTVGFAGISRDQSASYATRNNSSNLVVSVASQIPAAGNVVLYGRGPNAGELRSAVRLSFYSIGEALDLALLDARVTTLMNDIDGAI